MSIARVQLGQVAVIVQGGRHRLTGDHFVDSAQGYPAFGAGGLNGYLASYEFDNQIAVVLSSIGARCGKCFLASGRWSSLANTQVILPDPARADARYLWYQLNDEASWLRSGTAQPFIKPSTVRTREVLLPPLSEQRRIADILDKADAIRRKRKEAIALTEELLRSAFLEMFGDPVTNPKGWPMSTFGAEVTLLEYGPRFYNEKYSDDGVRIVRITDLDSSGALNFESMPRLAVDAHDQQRYLLRPGDIIFARSGATVGKSALSGEEDPPAIPGAYFIRLRFGNAVSPRYARQVLASESIQKIIVSRSRQSAQQNFSGPGLRELPLPMPPRIAQSRLEAIAAGQAKHLGQLKCAENEADRLFHSLVKRAFSGSLEAQC